jgi:hypothetical protein
LRDRTVGKLGSFAIAFLDAQSIFGFKRSKPEDFRLGGRGRDPFYRRRLTTTASSWFEVSARRGSSG